MEVAVRHLLAAVLFIFLTLHKRGAINADEVLATTPDQYLALAKCSFVVHGEFTYSQAVAACESRGAYLGFFVSPSEEQTVRTNIEWKAVPGYKRENNWIGQLWLGMRKSENGSNKWVFDNALFPKVQIPFAAFARTEMFQQPPHLCCLIMREDGWVPYHCNATVANGDKKGVGALCTSFSRTQPKDPITANSLNYCGNSLLPPSASSIALPLMAQKNYFFIRGRFTFEEACRCCSAKGGHLASARNEGDVAFIEKHLDFTLVNDRAWLGLRRLAPDSSSFIWVDDGAANGYTGLFEQDYDDRGDCVAFELGGDDGQLLIWKKLNCYEKMSAVCETFTIY